jgi:hypothetical protein
MLRGTEGRIKTGRVHVFVALQRRALPGLALQRTSHTVHANTPTERTTAMGLFLDNIVTPTDTRPPLNVWAVTSIIVSLTGFINIVGFLVGPALAHIALFKMRRTKERGRALALVTLWVSYVFLLGSLVTLAVILIISYAALPSPGDYDSGLPAGNEPASLVEVLPGTDF